MTFTLYNAPQSTCSQRVRFVLNAKTIPFDEIKLDLLAGDQLKPDYLALNPNGVVPTLDHNGAIIIDSSVIIEYLDEIAPEPAKFTPENPVLRAKMRALMHFIDEMAAAAVRVPTFNLAFLPRFAAMSEDAFKAFAELKPLRREFMLAMGRTGFPQKDMDEALARLRRTYERMDSEIAKSGGPWLLGAGRERHPADAHAGGVEDGVGDGRRDRPARRFAGARRRDLRMVDQHHVDLFGRLGDVEDRIGQPIDAGHGLVVELDLLPQRAADALHDVALDRHADAVRIDDLAAIMGDRELAHPDLAAAAVDVDLGDHRDARAVALRVGDAAAGDLVAGLVLARRRPGLPARLLRRRLDDGDVARILDVAQAELDRIDVRAPPPPRP